jgi:Ca2+/H+ antiporter, TMEM165/GDT1 family
VVDLYLPAVIGAFIITLVEMTEVVALVFALGSHHGSIRTGALGAIAGTAAVSLVALAFGAALVALPRSYLLWGSSIALIAFGLFLFRSTVRSYRRARAAHAGSDLAAPPTKSSHAIQFGGGFSVGVVEAVETVIVLIALAAAGYGVSALVGALAGGVLLVGVAAAMHERVRRLKVPLLKLGATSLLFAFAVFWAGEALGFPWPGADLILIPLFAVSFVLVRSVVGFLSRAEIPLETKG